jgi:hypothetical protein
VGFLILDYGVQSSNHVINAKSIAGVRAICREKHMNSPTFKRYGRTLLTVACLAGVHPLLNSAPAQAGFFDRLIQRGLNSVERGVDTTVNRSVNKAVDCVTGYCPSNKSNSNQQNQEYPSAAGQQGYPASTQGGGYSDPAATGGYPDPSAMQGGYPDPASQGYPQMNQGGYPQQATPTATSAVSQPAVIADITTPNVTLNKGTEGGFTKGMTVSIERVVKPIKDPQTGRVLRVVTSPVGQIQITEVGNGFAVGTIKSGKGFKVGDTAKPL